MRSDDAVGFGVALLRADGADLAWHARPIVSAVAHSNRFPSTGRLLNESVNSPKHSMLFPVFEKLDCFYMIENKQLDDWQTKCKVVARGLYPDEGDQKEK